MLLFLLLQDPRNGDLTRTGKTQLLPQERYQLVCLQAESALFTIGYAHEHVPSKADTYAELARGPWGIGGVWRAMAVRPDGITISHEERSWAPRRLPGHRVT